MDIVVHEDRERLGQAAAVDAARALTAAVETHGAATFVIATGASQFATLATLGGMTDVPWERITLFHLDEYVGLSDTHPASFRKFLRERFVDRLPRPPVVFHTIDGRADPTAECRRLATLVPAGPFDVATIGIGENGHLAFNDPPADFVVDDPYIVVTLDEACRRQQVGEGWFAGIEDVPRRAISMSIRRLLATRTLVCSVPDGRKAEAVRGTVEGPVVPGIPASILQTHPRCRIHLDRLSAALLAGGGDGRP